MLPAEPTLVFVDESFFVVSERQEHRFVQFLVAVRNFDFDTFPWIEVVDDLYTWFVAAFDDYFGEMVADCKHFCHVAASKKVEFDFAKGYPIQMFSERCSYMGMQ